MPEPLRQLWAQLSGFWKGLPTPKRIALIAATIGSLLLVLGAVLLGQHENYTYLFTELSTEDTAAVVEKLKAQQVPYRLDDSGTRVEVPENRVHELRLELASQGLPRGGGVGFEIFDKSQLGSTEFEQQVNLRRALEGELGRSIQTLRGVQAARVHLVMPERRLFVAGQDRASASVVLKLRSPEAFSRDEIAGIVHLVASAVPGLSRDRVSVVSADGMTLHRPTLDGESTSGSGDLAEQGTLMGSALETRAREQLERVVGPGLADVRVNVTINPATREKTQELYNKDTIALRSEHKVEEMTGANQLPVAGVPGAQSNLPDAKPGETETTTTSGGPGGVFRRTQTRNWEVDRTVEKTSTPPGEIQRLTVAVLVDQSHVVRGGKEVSVPRTKEEVAALEEIVRKAVGFDTVRGDSLTIQSMAFHRDDLSDVKLNEPVWWRRYVPLAMLAVVVLVALMMLSFRSRHDRKLAAARRATELKLAQRAAAVLAGGPVSAADALPGDGMAAPALPAVDYRAQALELASRDPATATLVLKGWLAEPLAAKV
ncbi:MAG TPA: flagellar basal-body MS-ring/collar protein FliF [Polyangiaceae bacterium]|nr:flagellar basal-body MS-ring/collar protein FliF [Polyangiaceae bacterium]